MWLKWCKNNYSIVLTQRPTTLEDSVKRGTRAHVHFVSLWISNIIGRTWNLRSTSQYFIYLTKFFIWSLFWENLDSRWQSLEKANIIKLLTGWLVVINSVSFSHRAVSSRNETKFWWNEVKSVGYCWVREAWLWGWGRPLLIPQKKSRGR